MTRRTDRAARWAGVSLTLCLCGLAGCGDALMGDAPSVEKLRRAPSEGTNDFYVGNRPPLLASPLIKLPIGAVRPEGWLRHQLELQADGMTGHLHQLSPWCKFDRSAWVSPTGEGEHGWEEAVYWLKGFVDLGYILEDDRILTEGHRWIDGILASQREDGYFGPEANRANFDLWPNMVALYVLRSHYEATSDERVIPFMLAYCKWMSTIPMEKLLPGSWMKWRAGDNLDSIYWLYNRTGEDWLLDVARVNHERTADWTGGIPTWHGVNLCQCFREPAIYYQQTHDIRYLRAANRNYQTFMGIYGQVPGGMFGADENCREGYTGPRQAAETCSMVEFMHSFEILTRITGSATWADRCEEVAFNSLPAALTPDLKALHYLTAPNMIQLDRRNKSPMLQNAGDMLSYTPYAQYRCCQHNVAFGWPYFAEHLWMATPGNGLAAVMYAPSEVTAKVGDGVEVTIRETTIYPFEEYITFSIETSRPVRFPLLLRIPRWVSGEADVVRINGQDAEASSSQPFGQDWIRIDREWHDGDNVLLTLPMEIGALVWEQNRNAVSIGRGPLWYSLDIEEDWREYDNGKEWKAFEVFPASAWNYGLVLDAENPEQSLEFVPRSGGKLADQPFSQDNAPIYIKATGKRIPQWKQEENGLVGAIQEGPIRSDEPAEEIRLIPMGCARLRISAFPMIGDGPDARPWEDLAVKVTASHTSNSLLALNDGIVPEQSDNTEVPRFTWWPHRGTGEWVQYEFAQPREMSACEVFWYDDTGKGKCRPPASWKIQYTDGDTWKEVQGASGYGTELHQFNRVTFPTVNTRRVRLYAELEPNYCAGILEWRVGEE